ncbi:exo-beta-N-acetylmuramidase NamZ family protein [Melioribacter sp. Ez-97]|uniref:exo-beta-N-acetylmuramidase NamZ family protein n=1 Tax=Melioribacter sp. Ez-97 TaxID=3423434 RepID=UPI003EDB6021
MKKISFLFFLFILKFACPAQHVLPGIDVLIKHDFAQLSGKNVGLITNPTGVNKDLISTVDIFLNSEKINLVAVFTPEHGLYGTKSAGELVDSESHKKIKVYSLYGETKKPTREMLKDIDALVYDIQDVGLRSYTYISTLGLAMEAAAENNKEFVILDRPNPFNGIKTEGALLDTLFKSFVGFFPIPYIYGLTPGELGRFINGEILKPKGKECNLKVIPMEGWNRGMSFEDTGLLWTPTSNHVPDSETPYYMAATGILGELNVVSIGVGYTLPFRTIAAGWIDPELLAARMNALNLRGVKFRPISYKPYYGKWKDTVLNGVQIYITDKDAAELLKIQFYFMEIHNELYPGKKLFSLADSSRIKMFDLVMGTDKIRKAFTKNYKVNDIKELLNEGLDKYKKDIRKYLIYK